LTGGRVKLFIASDKFFTYLMLPEINKSDIMESSKKAFFACLKDIFKGDKALWKTFRCYLSRVLSASRALLS